jgi:hypothetical protein
MQRLDSFHDSPSYWIQATKSELRTYERGFLAIVVSGGGPRRLVWRGEFEGRFRDDFSPHLEEAVRTLLERFPPPTEPAAPDPTPPPPSRKPKTPANERPEKTPSRSASAVS